MTSNVAESNPLISVILPTYNGGEYLAEAIESILNQSIADFELIAIDDGSTDSSLAVLKSYESKDCRIKVITRPNKGLANTLNEALFLARGKWIARMDQDDIALPLRFEKQLDYLKFSGADIVGSWVKRFGAKDNRTVMLPQSDDAIRMALLFESPFAHPAVMMRAELAQELGYNHKWDKAEDYDLWVRAAIAGWKMANVPEILLLYRVHATQISTAASNRQSQLSLGIRKLYWSHMFSLWGKDPACIDSVLNTRVFSVKTDIDEIETALTEVLRNCNGEARLVVLSHALRIYYRIAANYSDIVLRWSRLCKQSCLRPKLRHKIILQVLRLLRIQPESKFFISMRAILIFIQAR
jgi:glycosyltransferase involved in cell wall biosynthesis